MFTLTLGGRIKPIRPSGPLRSWPSFTRLPLLSSAPVASQINTPASPIALAANVRDG